MLLSRKVFHTKWLQVISPIDRKKPKQWSVEHERTSWVKHQIAHFVDPDVIVEIGVRAGYSAWAMLAASSARLFGYDNYSREYDVLRETISDVEEQYELWARKILSPFHATLDIANSQKAAFTVPRADLYHVDGDHREKSAWKDIRNCMKASSIDSVIVVHDYVSPPVRIAAQKAATKHEWEVFELVEPMNGDALLFQGEIPSWVHDIDTGI